MVILKFALKRSFRSPVAILVSFILPVALMLLSSLWEEVIPNTISSVDGRGPYFMALVMLFGALPLTRGMIYERRERTIVRIMSTPTTTFDYLSQNLMACLIPLLMQIFMVCTLGRIMYDWTIGFTLWIGLFYVIFATTSISFCFAWNCLFKNNETSFSILSMVLTFATFILILPLSIFPDVVRKIFMILPTYWVATGLEQLITYGATMQFAMALANLVLFTAIFLVYGSKRGVY